MQPHLQARRRALHLRKEERHEDQEQGKQGVKGDANDVQEKQEDLPEEVPQVELGRDRGVIGQEEVRPFPLLKEEERAEERTQAQGHDLQPVDNRQTASPIRVTCQSPCICHHYIVVRV